MAKIVWDDKVNTKALGTHAEEIRADDMNDLKRSLNELYDGTFAEIHVHDGVTAQSIPTGATYTKLISFNNNGESANCTPDQANGKITITKTGRYLINHSWSGLSDTSNTVFWGTVFLDGVEQDQMHWKRKFGIASDVGSCSATGIILVTSAPLDLDFRVRHDDGGSIDLTTEYANLNINFVGDL